MVGIFCLQVTGTALQLVMCGQPLHAVVIHLFTVTAEMLHHLKQCLGQLPLAHFE